MKGTTIKREELFEKARQYKRVPGHGKALEDMTDKELEVFIGVMETMSRVGREAAE